MHYKLKDGSSPLQLTITGKLKRYKILHAFLNFVMFPIWIFCFIGYSLGLLADVLDEFSTDVKYYVLHKTAHKLNWNDVARKKYKEKSND